MDFPRGLTLEQAHAERIQREMADLRRQLQDVVLAVNARNAVEQPRRQRVEDDLSSSHGNGGSSQGSDSDHSIEIERGRRRRNHRPQQQQHHHREEEFKVDFPNFEGNLNPDDFLDWIRSMERAFEYNTYDDEKKFKMATLRLKGYASLWWDTTKSQRVREGKTRIRSWEKLKRLMKRRFLPDDYKQDLYLKLTLLQQDKRSLEECTREFDLLQLRCDIQEPQERTIVRFVHGLNEEIASKVELQHFWTLDDAKKLAIKVEKQVKAGKKHYTRPYNSGSSLNPKGVSKGEIGSSNKKTDFKAPTTSMDVNVKKKCFKCQGFGHFQADCPNRRIMTIQEIEEIEEELKQEALDLEAVNQNVQDEDEEIVEQPDSGAVLVIRRALHSVPIIEEADRENIFQTRCTVQGRVCSLIIDSGSCTNVASSTLVEKLNLPTTKHKQPYKLRWLTDGSRMQVSK
ncbi:hypothetical protein V5N11_015534 [Cardamine amara subsp. amara]|uniref:CCHC-type domain-containing protein n=1 Tax=Cardamine amara subsp. amara TaxID=228776 RepID=A0ABD0Z5X4_CARAN